MDQRQTFGSLENLMAILQDLHLFKAKVSLLLDNDGLTREEGFISLLEKNESLTETFFTIENSNLAKVYLREVIAVNGIFRSDYSEC